MLSFNPWGDDDSNYRVLRNQMVVVRYPHKCAMCFERIPARSRVRAQTECYDGQAMTFRFCPACCRAMGRVVSGKADIDVIERRMELGRRNARPTGRREG